MLPVPGQSPVTWDPGSSVGRGRDLAIRKSRSHHALLLLHLPQVRMTAPIKAWSGEWKDESWAGDGR